MKRDCFVILVENTSTGMNLIKSRIQSGDDSVEMIETQFVAIDEKKRRSD